MKKIILLILMSFVSFLGYSQLTEGFEGAPSTPDATGVWTLPESTAQGLGSWLVRDNRTNGLPNWQSNVLPFPANTGSKAAFVNRENTGPGVTAEEWLITPQIAVPANTQLRFFTRQTLVGDPGTKYQIRVSNSATQSDLAAFTILAEYTETELSTITADQLDYEEKVINLPFSGSRYFAFVKVFTQLGAATSGDRWLVDDVRLLQRCIDPAALNVDSASITASSVIATWDDPAPSNQTQFEIEYGPSGFTLGTGTLIPSFTTGTPGFTPRTKLITGLTELTAYQYYVRAICALSSSEWVGPFNFTTKPLGSTCGAPIVLAPAPVSVTSDTNIYGNNINGTTGCGATGAYLGGNDVVYSYTVPLSTTGLLSITMNPQGATDTGVFVYSSCANIGVSCLAGVGNATANIRTIPSLTVIAGQTIYIVISSTTATPTFIYNLIIQDVNCLAPTNLNATTITTNSATLSWAIPTGSAATSWQVAVQPSGSAIPTGAGTQTNNHINLVVSTLLPTATPLAPDTDYQYWVRADCNNGTFSIWSGPYLFSTLPTCPQPTFPVIGPITSSSITLGWTNVGTATAWEVIALPCGSLAPTITNVGIAAPTNPFNITGLTSDTCYDLYVRANCGPGDVSRWTGPISASTQITPPACGGTFSDPGGSSAPYANSTNSTVTIFPTNPGDVVTVTFTSFDTEPNYDGLYVFDGNSITAPQVPSANPPGNGQLTLPGAYWGTAIPGPFTSTSGDGSLTFQFITDTSVTREGWTATVTCAPGPVCPKPSSLTVNILSATSVELGWVNNGPATSWQYIIQPVGSAPPTAGTPGTPIATNPYTVTGLTAETSYDFYVRGDCGTDGFSLWSGPRNFTTPPSCIKPTALTASNIDTTSALLGWNSSSTAWQVLLLPAGSAAPTVGTLGTPVATNPYNATGLTLGTCYDYYVRSDCGPVDGLSTWAGPFNFCTTVCSPTQQCNYTFNMVDSFGDGWNGNTMSIFQNGIVVATLTGPTQADGQNPLAQTVPLCNGVSFSLVWNTGGAFANEVGVSITSFLDEIIYTKDPGVGTQGATLYTGTGECTPPTCLKPTNLAVSTITENTAQLSWTSNGTATSWQVLALAAGSLPPTPSTTGWTAVSTNPYTVTGLTSGTCYDLYVRGDCGAIDGVSNWAGPVNVCTTICQPSTQCNYTFTISDSFGDGWNGATMQIKQNGIVVGTIGSTFTTGTGPITVSIPLCNGIPFELFWNAGGTFPGEVRVSIQNTFNQPIYSLSVSNAALVGTVLYSGTVDCFNPLCLPPTDLSVSGIGTYSATINWTSSGVPTTSWGIYVVPTGQAPGVTPTYTTSSNPFVIPLTPGLLADTTYDVYIQSICSVNSPSILTGPVTFTTLPTCPRPIDLRVVGSNSLAATLAWNEAGTATSWYIYVQPVGSGIPPLGAPHDILTTLPTDAAPYDTQAFFGSLAPGFYEFYVRSVCSSTDISAPAGPVNFFIVSLPVCASVDVALTTTVPGILDYCAADCVDLEATYTDSGDTTTYNVSAIPFAPPFPFTGGTEVSVNIDDIWSNSITLPFNFCFFGVNYPSIQIGSNGVLTFTPQTAPGYCNWPFTQTIPSPTFPIRNAIYGVYQDINPSTSTAPLVHNINYQILGTAPCRTFVVNFYQVAQFSCGSSVGLQTSQVVLYETSNIVEVYVQDRTSCTTWNSGSGLIGIQNEAGSQAHVPPGRNTGTWEAHNEAWKFKPAGPSNVVFSWLKDGVFYSSTPAINVCFTQTTNMTAQAVYSNCGGTQLTKTFDVLLRVNNVDVQPITDVNSCTPYQLPALTAGNYFSSPNGVDPITNTLISSSQMVYVYAQSGTTPNCTDQESFNVTIGVIGQAPVQPNVSECTTYTLPTLNAPFAYYSQTGGVGLIDAAAPITTLGTQQLYIYGQSGTCTSESTFTVTIGAAVADTRQNVTDCISYTLTQLNANNTYYTQPNGPTGSGTVIPVGTVISTTQTVYIYAQTGTCTAESQFTITIVNSITPTFDPIASVCVGATPPTLPTTSTNTVGITGTWSPSIVDTSVAGPFTFNFTPDAGQACAVPTSLTVTVNPTVTPTFNAISNICLNGAAPDLPTTAIEGVTGTWLPPAIDTTVAGTFTFTFTPDAGQPCTTAATLDVTIIGQITPTFASIPNICQNGIAPNLPTTSIEDVTGTWSPGSIDTSVVGTVCYTFTPDAIFTCATTAQLCVTIDPQLTPTFAAIADICLNDVAPALPSISTNAITGTWSPATIDPSVAGTACYTFTPDAVFTCTATSQLCVTIKPQTVPDFASPIVLCVSDVAPILLATSPNGVTGTWSPTVIDNTISGTYTFTPNGAPVPSANLVTNGDFSAGNTGFTSDYSNIPNAGSFGIQKAYGVLPNPFDWFFGFAACVDHTSGSGNQMVVDGSTSNGGNDRLWCQSIPVVPGQNYTFSYYLQSVAQPNPAVIDVLINNGSVGSATAGAANCNWTQYSYVWNSGTNTIADICLYDRTLDVSGNDFAIDDISFGIVTAQCATSQIINVFVTPTVTPNFAAIPTFCSGTAAPSLLSVSPNNITGTWSPAIIDNTTDGCYVFTPNVGQCAINQTLCVTVIPSVDPDFPPIPGFCAGATAPILATTSPITAVVGTWSPSVISNSIIGTSSYTFTPNAGQCASIQVLTVEVTDIPMFTVEGGCEQDLKYHLTVVPSNNFDVNAANYSWTLNGQPISASTQSIIVSELGSGTYEATVTTNGCSAAEPKTVSSISCTIQRGISPKGINSGDGLNDYFDLEGLDVKKLEIFNRYGTIVYTKNNYSKEWYGQSEKGNELPDGTYFYVIARDGVENVTGWIYINREQ
ncbi:MAG: fibronectin type III domain-containing protein [Burkholderiales bacterium]|nr:fibronectin type III domain-containing protein [Flavobacterium sp.]